ncbi:MAG: hypothetical protein NXI21_12120 [Alphaproteobacteria bacterium]|nr:hypothetical protein [Alphaproteobacteria bacterium]
MEDIAILGAASPVDLVAAAFGGFSASFGGVAFGATRAGGLWGALIHGAFAVALLFALTALIVTGPWAPLLIAAGIGLLIAPPVHDRSMAVLSTGAGRRTAAVGLLGAAVVLVVGGLV